MEWWLAGLGAEWMGSYCSWVQSFSFARWRVLQMDDGDHCTTIWMYFILLNCTLKKWLRWASLVAQWLRICLPMQGTRVRALVWEDPTCRGVAGPMSHNYWACASGACAPQHERPAHHDEEWPPLAATRESPRTETKTQHSHK